MKLKGNQTAKGMAASRKGVRVHLISALVPALSENSLLSYIAEQKCLTS